MQNNKINLFNIPRFSSLLSMLGLSFLLCVSSAMANTRNYAVDVESSSWGLSEQTRLRCELTHVIPGYGKALFMTEASKQLNLEFTLDMLRLPDTYGVADVYSMPPKWMRGAQQRKIGQVDLRRQYAADAEKKTAWQMLTELEKGFWPTIYYSDWLNQNDKIAVSLNASNFKAQYESFSQCISMLLPYSFEDIAYTVLSYKNNSSKLSSYSQRRLSMIAEYLKEDLALELVLVDAYDDSYGGDWVNEQLTLKRANEIKDFFADLGIDTSRIEVTGHGEKRHISSNETAIERQKNKRVIIRMSKQDNIL